MLEVRNTKNKGRGVFTKTRIEPDTVVEISHVIVLSSKTTDEKLKEIGLDQYCYDFKGRTALALGFGSLFNHSETPNCHWHINRKTIVYIANQIIKPNEELTIDYGIEVWFDLL